MSDKIELPNFGVILESLAQRKDLSSEIAQLALAQVLEGNAGGDTEKTTYDDANWK